MGVLVIDRIVYSAGEAGGTSLNNPFVLKGVQGGFGQLSSPFAQSPPPVLTEQQFGQGVRRTRSADCPLAAYPGPVDQPQQLIVPNVKSTNSAPVSLPVTVHGTSGFQFPDKQNSQFYIPKIQVNYKRRLKQLCHFLIVITERKLRKPTWPKTSRISFSFFKALLHFCVRFFFFCIFSLTIL